MPERLCAAKPGAKPIGLRKGDLVAFDTRAALAKILAEYPEHEPCQPATLATPATQIPKVVKKVASVADAATHPTPETEKPLIFSKRENVAKVANVATHPKPTSKNLPSAQTLIDLFQERAAIFEFDAGLTRDAATRQAAVEVFATPEDRIEYFTGTGTLKPRFKQVTLAIIEGILVTFHGSGKVSFWEEN